MPEYQAMASSSPTTTLAKLNNLTPTRRTSYKDHTDVYHSTLNEKKPTIPRSNNPFDDMHYTTTPSSSPPPSDIEAQEDLPFKPKPKKQSRFPICVLLLCFIIFWGALIVGFFLVLDTVFPGAVRYDKLKELKDEMLDTEKAVAMMKAQVRGLVAYVNEGLKGSSLMGAGGEQVVDGVGNLTMPVGLEGGVVSGAEGIVGGP